MKKLNMWFSGLIVFISLFFQASPAYADICPAGDFSGLCNLDPKRNPNAISRTVAVVVITLIIIAIIVAILYLIMGGIKYITSGGDKGKVDAARSHITAAIIGLILALLAFFIVNVVAQIFTGQNFNNFKIPTIVP